MEVHKSTVGGRVRFLNFSQRVAIEDVDVAHRIKAKFELAQTPDEVRASHSRGARHCCAT